MQDKTLITIAIATSIVGLVGLFFVYIYCQPESQQIERVKLFAGQEVTVKGQVRQVTQKQDSTIAEVGYDTTITVIVQGKEDIKPGQKVIVTGTTKEYNGQIEILGDKLLVQN